MKKKQCHYQATAKPMDQKSIAAAHKDVRAAVVSQLNSKSFSEAFGKKKNAKEY